MNWLPIPSPNYEIRDIKMTIFESEVYVSWFWPNEIDFVYIYKTALDCVLPIDQIKETELKLYTREEFKANQGFVFSLNTMGQIALRIFPGKKVDGNLVAFHQQNKQNLVHINGSRARIFVSITYKHKLFQARKKVRISIMTELPIEKDLLVYVKKSGSIPLSVNDGTVYPFIRDLPSGKTVTPEIEIDKHEFIKIFFNKGKQAAQAFELIPE